MTTEQQTIEAIYGNRLAELDEPATGAVCSAIGQQTAKQADEAMAHLAAAGLGGVVALVGDPARPAQRHEVTIEAIDGQVALEAAGVLAEVGYRPWDRIDGPSGEIARRFRSRLTLAAATTSHTSVLHLTWPSPEGIATRLPASAVPNSSDAEALSRLPLPSVLKRHLALAGSWPLLFALRPVRLVAKTLGARLGRPGSGSSALGPFLSTPGDLIDPLLDLASVGAHDVLVDLGCGDGRILLAAAERGARAIGVEREPDLVAAAQQRSAEAGVGGLVEVIEGDAFTVGGRLVEGTVFFVFVPSPVAVQVVEHLLATVSVGTRVVVHEQHRLPNPPPGARSEPLVRGQGVTVAHLWTR